MKIPKIIGILIIDKYLKILLKIFSSFFSSILVKMGRKIFEKENNPKNPPTIKKAAE